MADDRECCWHKLTRQSPWEPSEDEGSPPILTESEEEEEEEDVKEAEGMDLHAIRGVFQGHF